MPKPKRPRRLSRDNGPPGEPSGAGSAGEPAGHQQGILYVVATPIGNLADLSPRAYELLHGVAVLAAEDTRRAGRLLADRSGAEAAEMQADSKKPKLMSLHAHNFRARVPELLDILIQGRDVTVISDAGTPGVSDPGGALVAAAWEAGIQVIPVPGPSAVATAVSAAGFPAERYLFAGYVPKKPGRRETYWQWIDTVGETAVLFETPHRIERTLEEMAARWPGRLMLLARELTKLHEELVRDTVAAIWEQTRGRSWKGEITLVLSPPGRAARHADAEEELD